MAAINPIRLVELNTTIHATLKGAFDEVLFWVVADITNHTFRQQKNYHNFELIEKDPDSNAIIAKIAGKAWGNGSARIRRFEQATGQRFTNNINVLIQVKVNFHEVYGLSLDLVDIDTNFTLGVLEQQRQMTLALLVEKNDFIQKTGDKYSTRNNLLKLPCVIQYIAIVSSATSAGCEDFKHTLKDNVLGYFFLIDEYHTAVQGENNARLFLSRLVDVFRSGKNYDVVVIIRGGGAQADFLIFDNYDIGRAVAKFPIPIITGIGHQKNETVVDLMAHTPTKTPTKAAELIIAHNRLFEERMTEFQRRIIIKSQQVFSVNFQNVSTLSSIIVNNVRTTLIQKKDEIVNMNQIVVNSSKSVLFHNKSELIRILTQLTSKPKVILYSRLNDIENVTSNMRSFTAIYLKNQKGYVGHYVSIVKVMSPENILKRGFALVKIGNEIVTNSTYIQTGQDVDVFLSNARFKMNVKQKEIVDGREFDL